LKYHSFWLDIRLWTDMTFIEAKQHSANLYLIQFKYEDLNNQLSDLHCRGWLWLGSEMTSNSTWRSILISRKSCVWTPSFLLSLILLIILTSIVYSELLYHSYMCSFKLTLKNPVRIAFNTLVNRARLLGGSAEWPHFNVVVWHKNRFWSYSYPSWDIICFLYI